MLFTPAFKLALLPLAFASLSVIAAPPDPRRVDSVPEELTALLATIIERIEIADLVALTKWDSAKPIQDSDREAQVIANAQQQAASHGLDKDDVAQLLAAQIEANKFVQYGLLALWQAAGNAPATKRPDLKNQIRPHVDELQIRLLEQYARFSPLRTSAACSTWLNAARPRLASDQLHQLALVRATGELCTGNKPHG